MQSRLFLNLLMLIILLSLASIALFYKPNTDKLTPLTSLNINHITEIKILREKDDILLQKINQQWSMIKPYKIPAHEFRIQHVLKITQLESQKVYSSNALDLKKYALDKPRASIRFNNTLIEFGRNNPVTQQRYIKNGDKILLAYDDTYPLLRSQASSFIALNLFKENDKILSIKMPDFIVEKHENQWQITPEKSLSIDEIQDFIQNWKHASAFAVHAYLKRKDLGHIEIKTTHTKIIYEISDTQPWLILGRPDLAIEYHFDASMVKKILDIPSMTENEE